MSHTWFLLCRSSKDEGWKACQCVRLTVAHSKVWANVCVLIYGKEGFFVDQMPVCLIVGVEMLWLSKDELPYGQQCCKHSEVLQKKKGHILNISYLCKRGFVLAHWRDYIFAQWISFCRSLHLGLANDWYKKKKCLYSCKSCWKHRKLQLKCSKSQKAQMESKL